MMRGAALCGILAVLAACSSTPVRIDSRALDDQSAQSSDRYIIVAVENTPAAFVAHAGATPRGYIPPRITAPHCARAKRCAMWSTVQSQGG